MIHKIIPDALRALTANIKAWYNLRQAYHRTAWAQKNTNKLIAQLEKAHACAVKADAGGAPIRDAIATLYQAQEEMGEVTGMEAATQIKSKGGRLPAPPPEHRSSTPGVTTYRTPFGDVTVDVNAARDSSSDNKPSFERRQVENPSTEFNGTPDLRKWLDESPDCPF